MKTYIILQSSRRIGNLIYGINVEVIFLIDEQDCISTKVLAANMFFKDNEITFCGIIIIRNMFIFDFYK